MAYISLWIPLLGTGCGSIKVFLLAFLSQSVNDECKLLYDLNMHDIYSLSTTIDNIGENNKKLDIVIIVSNIDR